MRRAAGRERHHDSDWPHRIGLRAGAAGIGQHQPKGQEGNQLAHAGSDVRAVGFEDAIFAPPQQDGR
jgi:hypothetical protein